MLYQQIAQNKRKTAFLLIIFIIILALVGAGLGYMINNEPLVGIIWAVIGSLIYLFIVLQNPANLVMDLNHAQEIKEQDDPELYHVVQDMALAAQVPMPRVYLINDPSPNAFATGRDPKHSSVAVTKGLREKLNREELEGVLGHELSHVRNYDILVSTIGVVLVAVISFIASFASRYFWWFGPSDSRDDDRESSNAIEMIFKLVAIVFVLILGPLAASLAQMALSRNREYLADAGSVELTRNPQGLISALEKISNSGPMKQADRSSAGMYIENPFKNGHGFSSLFDTHPPTSERIKRLEKM
ncbi:zinc metalloprotease HtpX [Lactobacillus hominis]|uniref:Protease HtpX homolog n=1 Tax=Lactobacillus hominis DSM 23910 = CRBIP 24.179 TaxID=1423758 RepID=I7IVH4_9LACO|nr:zinc metalloprotease HtpX [Lactobacillus hominis]KRM84776.1 protease htpx-like protein [Lactobacillus hominis DSM 23910 = CRBIP 24.179]MCT3347820.1 zinc metalloprotease HtpX [Lactobacillus hominis]CCI81448.1 Protease HtpX homolog 1 [Lactobacillus hominis DSM 23910 = CRBIP 24.179]